MPAHARGRAMMLTLQIAVGVALGLWPWVWYVRQEKAARAHELRETIMHAMLDRDEVQRLTRRMNKLAGPAVPQIDELSVHDMNSPREWRLRTHIEDSEIPEHLRELLGGRLLRQPS